VHGDSTGREGELMWRRITPVGGGRPVRHNIPLGILIFLVVQLKLTSFKDNVIEQIDGLNRRTDGCLPLANKWE